MNTNTPSPSGETFSVPKKEETQEPTGELVTEEQANTLETKTEIPKEPVTPEMVIEEVQEPVKPTLKEEKNIPPSEIEENDVSDKPINTIEEASALQNRIG